jgi:hypothetical protein
MEDLNHRRIQPGQLDLIPQPKVEETADAIGKKKETLPQLTGKNPAEWIITRRLCIEWISVLRCLEVISPA